MMMSFKKRKVNFKLFLSIIVNQKICVVYICKVSVFQLGIFCSHTHRKAIAYKLESCNSF